MVSYLGPWWGGSHEGQQEAAVLEHVAAEKVGFTKTCSASLYLQQETLRSTLSYLRALAHWSSMVAKQPETP